LAVVLDELTYLLAVDASIAAALQNAWDHLLQGARLFLAISASTRTSAGNSRSAMRCSRTALRTRYQHKTARC
jgi:hypothetical protein